MLIRRTLQSALIALAAAVVLTFLWNVALGGLTFGDVTLGGPTMGGVISSYLLWGRWARLAMLLVFAALLIVGPLLPRARRAGHVMAAGAGIALVGDLIELSAGRFDHFLLESALPIRLVAGRLTVFSVNADPTYVWAGGLVLLGIGLLILASDVEDRAWSRGSVLLAIALVLTGLTESNVFGSAGVYWLASWVSMAFLSYWLLLTLSVTSASSTQKAWLVTS